IRTVTAIAAAQALLDRSRALVDHRLLVVAIAILVVAAIAAITAITAAEHLAQYLADDVAATVASVARIILRGGGRRTHQRGRGDAARNHELQSRHGPSPRKRGPMCKRTA